MCYSYPHLNTYMGILIKTIPLWVAKIYESMIDKHVNKNAVNFLYDTFKYVEIVEVLLFLILVVVGDKRP